MHPSSKTPTSDENLEQILEMLVVSQP